MSKNLFFIPREFSLCFSSSEDDAMLNVTFYVTRSDSFLKVSSVYDHGAEDFAFPNPFYHPLYINLDSINSYYDFYYRVFGFYLPAVSTFNLCRYNRFRIDTACEFKSHSEFDVFRAYMSASHKVPIPHYFYVIAITKNHIILDIVYDHLIKCDPDYDLPFKA